MAQTIANGTTSHNLYISNVRILTNNIFISISVDLLSIYKQTCPRELIGVTPVTAESRSREYGDESKINGAQLLAANCGPWELE